MTHWFVDYRSEALSVVFWLSPSWFLTIFGQEGGAGEEQAVDLTDTKLSASAS